MNNRLDASSYPVKGAVIASRAKHLVASADFEDACTAFGTGARFRIDEFCGCEVVRVAFVWRVVGCALYFMTILARPHIAKIALPLRAEKSATIARSVGTGTNKCGCMGRH